VSNTAMFSDFNFVDYVVIFFGVLLTLKRVAQMERYHYLRVIILTSIFGVILVLFVLELGSMFDESEYPCTYPSYCYTSSRSFSSWGCSVCVLGRLFWRSRADRPRPSYTNGKVSITLDDIDATCASIADSFLPRITRITFTDRSVYEIRVYPWLI